MGKGKINNNKGNPNNAELKIKLPAETKERIKRLAKYKKKYINEFLLDIANPYMDKLENKIKTKDVEENRINRMEGNIQKLKGNMEKRKRESKKHW